MFTQLSKESKCKSIYSSFIHHNHTQQNTSECDLCEFKSTTTQTIEMHKQEYHVLVQCEHCNNFFESRTQLEKHSEEKHKEDTSQKCCDLAKENAELKEELRAVKDNFERLSDIYKKKQEDFNEQKLIIEIDLAKTREAFRQVKTENEELKVRNDTLFKLVT